MMEGTISNSSDCDNVVSGEDDDEGNENNEDMDDGVDLGRKFSSSHLRK